MFGGAGGRAGSAYEIIRRRVNDRSRPTEITLLTRKPRVPLCRRADRGSQTSDAPLPSPNVVNECGRAC